MRYNIHPRQPHRNLMASKRSIVLTCASIAMVLGTTSVGSSLFVDDTQNLSLPPASSIPAAMDQALTPTLPLTVPTQPLGKQQPLVLNPTKPKATSLIIDSIPVAAAAVLAQLSKNYPPTPKISPIVTPTPAEPPTNTTASTDSTGETSNTTSPPPAPETPPPNTEEEPAEPPTSEPEEPAAQNRLAPSSSSTNSTPTEDNSL